MNRIQRAEAAAPRQLWAQILVPMLVVIAIVVAFAGAWYARSGNDASQSVQESTRRTDCRSAYNADFTEVVRRRDGLNTTFNRQLGAALLARVNGEPPDPVAIAAFEQTNTDLAAAQRAVDALPKLDDAVDHGYTLNGIHHPACPG